MLACGGASPPELADIRTLALLACSPSSDAVEANICRCAFDELAADREITELVELDEALRGRDAVPPEVQEAVLSCLAEAVEPPRSKGPGLSKPGDP